MRYITVDLDSEVATSHGENMIRIPISVRVFTRSIQRSSSTFQAGNLKGFDSAVAAVEERRDQNDRSADELRVGKHQVRAAKLINTSIVGLVVSAAHTRGECGGRSTPCLSGFLRGHHEEIISEFAIFAKTLMPSGPEMTEAELRDHAEDILTAVVQDMSIAQSPEEQFLKSRGGGAAKTMKSSGTLHADSHSSKSCRISSATRYSTATERRLLLPARNRATR